MTEDAMAAFDRAVEDLTDAVYEPVTLLGEQQGVYCALCRGREDLTDSLGTYYSSKICSVWYRWDE